jgi:hypothetical protein
MLAATGAIVALVVAVLATRRLARASTLPLADSLGEQTFLAVNVQPFRDGSDLRETLHQLAVIQTDTVVIDIHWAWFEPTRPGEAHWNPAMVERLDAFLASLPGSARVVATILEAPSWAQSPSSSGNPQAENWTGISGIHVHEFSRFVQSIVRRYKWRIGCWEIWTEPNIPDFSWIPSPAEYVELLRTGFEAVRSADPRAIVVGGVLGAWSANPKFPASSWDYLDEMYRAGARRWMDQLSVHCFTDGYAPDCGPPGYPATNFVHFMERMREVMLRHGDSRSVWLTQIGWSTVEPDACANCWSPKIPVTEEQQAAFLDLGYSLAVKLGFVSLFAWYDLADFRYGSPELDNRVDAQCGLFRVDGGMKQSGRVMIRLATSRPAANLRRARQQSEPPDQSASGLG